MEMVCQAVLVDPELREISPERRLYMVPVVVVVHGVLLAAQVEPVVVEPVVDPVLQVLLVRQTPDLAAAAVVMVVATVAQAEVA
jgi:hypothetical protein